MNQDIKRIENTFCMQLFQLIALSAPYVGGSSSPATPAPSTTSNGSGSTPRSGGNGPNKPATAGSLARPHCSGYDQRRGLCTKCSSYDQKRGYC